MTDFPNSVTDAQLKLREDMHGSRNWKERQAAQPSPTRTNKLVSAFVVFLFAFLIVFGMVAAASRAAERPQRTWVLWDEASDRQFRDHRFTSVTACNVDVPKATKGAPSGLRISCRQVKGE